MDRKCPLLSIIIISHNQREELRRCIDSVLAMHFTFSREIIVSDDRSDDGTREMLENEYSDKVFYSYCNSDDARLTDNSKRSGYNRCNAYKYATGKYVAHVDADDFLAHDAIVYQKQVEALEMHSECSIAMSGCLNVTELDGKIDMSKSKPYVFPKKMVDGEILTHKQYFQYDFFHINQCFMQRRNPNVDPVKLYGPEYIDSVITFHHMQYGDVVYVEASDYVYVSHESSIINNVKNYGAKDTVVLWCIAIYVSWLIPCWFDFFVRGYAYQDILNVVRLARSGYKLSYKSYSMVSGKHIYIYDVFSKQLHWYDKVRLWFIDSLMRFMKTTGFFNKFSLRLLKYSLYTQW